MGIQIKGQYDEKIHHISDFAMDWIIKNLNYFTINNEVSKNLRWELKSFIELVFLTNYLMRSSIWENDERLAEMICFINYALTEVSLEDTVYFDPDGVSGLAIAEEFTILVNKNGESFRHILKSFKDFDRIKLLQKIPFRLMDLKYSFERASVNCDDLPSYQQLYWQTIAGKRTSIAYMSTMDIYSITHTIFYLTDMGNRSIEEFLPTEEKQYLQRLTLKLLAVTIGQNNLDTMAELLMCCSFLGILTQNKANHILYQSAWNQLHKNQMQDGSVPSVTYDHRDYLDSKSKEEYRFINCYHTTLVTIGATTSWLSKGVG